MNRDLANHGRLLGPNRSLRPRPLRYSTQHVQPLGRTAEDGEIAVHHRGLAEGNIEPAAGRVRVVAAAGADRPLLVLDGLTELGRKPVAQVAYPRLAGAGWAPTLDHFEFRFG